MSTSDAAGGALTLRQVESVPPGARVRHVDELGDDALVRFIELVETDPSPVIEDGEFRPGDVIVYTKYYHVTAA